MRTKISKVARDLNVGVSTAVEFLRKHNIEVDEGPNARIDSDAVDMLTKEFSSDKNTKADAEKIFGTRREEKKERPRKEQRAARPEADRRPAGPRILGTIDLDNPKAGLKAVTESAKTDVISAPEVKAEVKKNPVPASAPAQETKTAAPAPEVKTEVSSTETKLETSAAAPAMKSAKESIKAELKPEVPKTEPKPETPKTEPEPESAKETPEATPKPAAPKAADVPAPNRQQTTPTAEQKTAQPESVQQEPTSLAAQTGADSTPFRLGGAQPQAPGLKVVGKIDLTAINQSTRPRKKSKAERGRAAGDADRKKRKRIGKEKVDIEKATQQPGFGADARKKDQRPDNRGNQQGQGAGGRDRGKKRDKRPVKVDISSEDVQKQVKETLARLTNKSVKKSVKFRKEKREEMHHREMENAEREAAESKILKITEFVTANDLASLMDVPVNKVISTCMNLGVMVSINQRLDAETINIVAEEFGFETDFVSADVTEAIETPGDKEEDLLPRPPIVTVMGHVDHGKTSLLDYIRKANVIAGEAGGITQHIGAYNVELNDGRHITFLDTPGHEAFTAMRARGAKVTDLCIIIVAADDAVMPQTVEAINHASAAGVPIVFAINKVDKPHANPDKIKEELAAMNYLVEDWGGKYQSQDISAKKGTGVDELMEKVLLEAEMLDMKANPNRKATGSIIESSLDKGRGYVATVLVQNGTLRTGDIILAGNHFGKVKAMFNERNQRIKEAGPATPALILGLNGAPTAGDTFNVMDTEQEAREIASKREQLQREQGLRTYKLLTLEDIGRRRAIGNFQELNIIVKGDVDGSIEALSDSLIKLSTEEVQVNVLHKAVGEISESDVTLAAASDAIIIGFQVRPSQAARRAAERDGVDIRLYSVIYQAIEEVKSAMEGMLAPEIKEEITGTAEVLEVYHISRVGTIAGTIIREGKIRRSCKVRLIRDGIVRYTGELGSLKRFKDDVKEVASGYDCGMSIAGYNDIKVGDIIEGFEEVEVNRSL